MVVFDGDLRRRISQHLDAFRPHHLVTERPELRPAAVAVAVVECTRRPDGDAPVAAFLLTARSARLRHHARQWALPGGRVDPGERAPDTARRELREELGVDVAASDVLGVLDDYPTRSGYVISPVVLWCGGPVALRPNPAEVAEVHHVPLDELDDPSSPRLVAIPESDAPVIQLRVRGSWLHAPTAAVLYQFREVAMHGRLTRVAHLEQPVWAWR